MKTSCLKTINGITLVALVVTIVVLIILAVISINAVLGDNGLISQAEKAADAQANAEKQDDERIGAYEQLIANTLAEKEGASSNEPKEKPLVTTVTTTTHQGVEAQDALGNPVKIPGGFKIASDSGSTVKEGIVIEDENENQFVWIPVSNINGDGSNKIKVDEETEVEITLGRYTFATISPGTPTLVQKGSEYAETTLAKVEEAEDAGTGDVLSYRVDSYFYELKDFRESNGQENATGTNSTAKDLEGFITSVETNHGYYFARYEASYSSGSEFGVGNNENFYKLASKVSSNKTESSWTPSETTEGYLWNFITQGNASKACRQMYYGNSYVESDLVNSYAWDTAIVYIQSMGNSNYANQNRGNNTSLLNTGETGDEKCKIFDMAGNVLEWTTEYSASVAIEMELASPCTYRGGYCYSDVYYTSGRCDNYATRSDLNFGFRPTLYCKTGA